LYTSKSCYPVGIFVMISSGPVLGCPLDPVLVCTDLVHSDSHPTVMQLYNRAPVDKPEQFLMAISGIATYDNTVGTTFD